MLKFDMKFNTCSIWFRDYDSGCGAYDHVGELEKKSSQTKDYWVFKPSYSFYLCGEHLEQIINKINELDILCAKDYYFKQQKELLDDPT